MLGPMGGLACEPESFGGRLVATLATSWSALILETQRAKHGELGRPRTVT